MINVLSIFDPIDPIDQVRLLRLHSDRLDGFGRFEHERALLLGSPPPHLPHSVLLLQITEMWQDHHAQEPGELD